MEVLLVEEQQKIDQNSQPTDDEDAALRTQLNTETKQTDDEKQSIVVPELDMEQLPKQTPQPLEIDKSLGQELLSPTEKVQENLDDQTAQVQKEEVDQQIAIEGEIRVQTQEVELAEQHETEENLIKQDDVKPENEQVEPNQEKVLPESMNTSQQQRQASPKLRPDTPRGSIQPIVIDSRGSQDQQTLNEEMMQHLKKLQEQRMHGSQRTLGVGEEMETIILEEQINQYKEEQVNPPNEQQTDRVQNNFDESEIHPNPKETNVQSEVREALNKSEIGEIFDTLQEFKQPGDDIVIDKEVIRNIIEMNKQLVREKEEMFQQLQMKDKEIQALQAQLDYQKNQRQLNVENSNLFPDVSGINHKSIQENNKDLSLYEVLNQSNNQYQRNFNQSWVLNVEKIMSKNEVYAPLIKQKKKPTPMDYLSRKPFSIGKLPSLKQRQNKSLEKSSERSKEYQKVPFSEKFKQSASNVILKNAPKNYNAVYSSTQQILNHIISDPIRNRIASNNETKLNGYKYTHGVSFTDDEAEQEVDKILRQEQQQTEEEDRYEDKYEDKYDDYQNQVEVVEEVIMTTEESPQYKQIERKLSYEDNQGYGMSYAPQQQDNEPFNFTLKPDPPLIIEPKSTKKVTVAPKYLQPPKMVQVLPQQINPTTSLHTFKDSPFPLLSQKQSYYNRAVQKQLINTHQNRIVHPIQNSSSLVNFKGTSTRDTNFRQTPGFNLK